MAAESKVYVFLLTPSGTLIRRERNFNPTVGSTGIENMLKAGSAFKVIAIFVVRDIQSDLGGPFLDEESGNSQYKVEESGDGITIAKRDLTGASAGVKEKSYFSDLANPTPFATVPAKLEDSVMGRGANWIVLDDGQGSSYGQRLVEARLALGLNADGTIPNGWIVP